MENKGEALRWRVGSSIYLANPQRGARLMSWDLKNNTINRAIIYWPSEAPQKTSYDKIRGGNPVLFPFASVCYDKGIAETWRSNGKRLPMPRHGFARDGQFKLIEHTETGFSAELEPTPTDHEAYPFNYQFIVKYIFDELSFKVIFVLKNNDTEKIPWSAGHHFYFNLPWHEKAKRSDYSIHLDYKKCAFYSPSGKLINEKDKERVIGFDDPRIVDRIHYKLKTNRVSFGPKSEEELTHIIIGNDPIPTEGTSVVTWTESDSSPFYCVEPWMGPPNSQEHGKGLHWVEPNESDSFEVEVSLY